MMLDKRLKAVSKPLISFWIEVKQGSQLQEYTHNWGADHIASTMSSGMKGGVGAAYGNLNSTEGYLSNCLSNIYYG